MWGKALSAILSVAKDPQAPHLPGTLVKWGRIAYGLSAGWIAVVWYTAYANMRTVPGSGPTLVLPGKPIISMPSRDDKVPAFVNGGGGSSGSGSGGSGSVTTGNAGTGGTNPFPGATGSRLDQGFDFTSKSFLAPADGIVVYSNPRVPGWNNGGLVAIRITSGPKSGNVMYIAEGIRPTVSVGQRVTAGMSLGTPTSNPYNGIVGNVEAGWANPASPTQPLAQVSKNPASVAWDFYNWIRSLGGPAASSTGNAGYP